MIALIATVPLIVIVVCTLCTPGIRPLWMQAALGRYYVRYDDGQRSQNFDWQTAADYQEMFGGAIVRR